MTTKMYAQLDRLRPCYTRFDESGEFLEYFENGIEVVSYLTYHGSTPFSDELWSLFDQMIRAFHGFACDYIAELVPSLDNFVSRDTEKFLASSRLESLVGVPERFLWPDHQTRGGKKTVARRRLRLFYITVGASIVNVRQRCTPSWPLASSSPPLLHRLGRSRRRRWYEPGRGLAAEVGCGFIDVWNSLLIYNPTAKAHALDEGKVTPAQTQLLLTKGSNSRRRPRACCRANYMLWDYRCIIPGTWLPKYNKQGPAPLGALVDVPPT